MSSGKKLTLTFDNGPTPGVTDKVLAALEARGLRATFFLVGEGLSRPGARELAERAHEAGHWVGNHTMTHGLPLGERSDPVAEVAEIQLAQQALGPLSHEAKLFRPNGRGQVGPHLLSRAALDHVVAGRYTVVLWDVYVRDVQDPAGWVDRALAAFADRDWSVLVVHDLPSGAMDHLPRLLDAVLAAGVEIVQDIPDHAVPVRCGIPASWVGEVSRPAQDPVR